MEIEIENRESHIYIKISGQASLNASGWKQIESARVDVISTIKQTGIYKLLFDCRDLSAKLSTLDRFLLAMLFVKENMRFVAARLPPMKITFVVNKSLIDAERFAEKVARNRGLHGLITEDMQEAFKWLGLDEPSKEGP